MHVAEMIRMEFLAQNAYTDDAFSHPENTLAVVKRILDCHERAIQRLNEGISLDRILEEEKLR